jgi:hypothetical protein
MHCTSELSPVSAGTFGGKNRGEVQEFNFLAAMVSRSETEKNLCAGQGPEESTFISRLVQDEAQIKVIFNQVQQRCVDYLEGKSLAGS